MCMSKLVRGIGVCVLDRVEEEWNVLCRFDTFTFRLNVTQSLRFSFSLSFLQVHFTILLDQKMGALKEPLLQFLVVANTTNSEKDRTLEDNTVITTVTVDIDTQLTLYGLVCKCVRVELWVNEYSSRLKPLCWAEAFMLDRVSKSVQHTANEFILEGYKYVLYIFCQFSFLCHCVGMIILLIYHE